MKPSEFDLTRFLPYLINRAGARFVSSFADNLLRHEVSLQEWRVLAALRHADAQRVSDLSAATSIDISTLSRILSAMQRRGLIERRRPTGGDARVVTVHATDRASAVTDRIIPSAQRCETLALAGFTPEEEQALKAMLVRVYRNIETAEGASLHARIEAA